MKLQEHHQKISGFKKNFSLRSEKKKDHCVIVRKTLSVILSRDSLRGVLLMERQPFDPGKQQQADNEQIWCELYRTLRPCILSWVYASRVPSWHGQENDVIEDILQETLLRTLKYCRLVEDGEALPIRSLTHFSKTIAHHYLQDLRRKDVRLVHFTPQEYCETSFVIIYDDDVDPADIALRNLQRKHVLELLARLIVDFPPQQRSALLTDLANETNFSEEPDVLRSAFYMVNIELRTYQRPRSTTPAERSRHSASLCIAYKRLKTTFHRRYHGFTAYDLN